MDQDQNLVKMFH